MSEQEHVQETVAKQPFNLETFVHENQKAVAIAGGGLAVVILALLYFFLKWMPEKSHEAQVAMFPAEAAFKVDSFDLALKGNVAQKGFEQIASDYSLTKSGKLAKYYAGVCNLHLKKYDAAIDFLGSFSTDDVVLEPVALSALGDAYMEKGNTEEGLSYYKKAADANDNEEVKPYFLFKLAQACQKFNKKEDAIKYYTELRNEYPRSAESRDAEKFLLMLDPTAAQ